jgi:hypothetical protein
MYDVSNLYVFSEYFVCILNYILTKYIQGEYKKRITPPPNPSEQG